MICMRVIHLVIRYCLWRTDNKQFSLWIGNSNSNGKDLSGYRIQLCADSIRIRFQSLRGNRILFAWFCVRSDLCKNLSLIWGGSLSIFAPNASGVRSSSRQCLACATLQTMQIAAVADAIVQINARSAHSHHESWDVWSALCSRH